MRPLRVSRSRPNRHPDEPAAHRRGVRKRFRTGRGARGGRGRRAGRRPAFMSMKGPTSARAKPSSNERRPAPALRQQQGPSRQQRRTLPATKRHWPVRRNLRNEASCHRRRSDTAQANQRSSGGCGLGARYPRPDPDPVDRPPVRAPVSGLVISRSVTRARSSRRGLSCSASSVMAGWNWTPRCQRRSWD